jgi:hypothetical protein
MKSGLEILALAARYASSGQDNRLDFAVALQCLKEEGLHELDVRWLLTQAYVDHFIEITLPGDSSRSFRLGGAAIVPASCFVLTEAGHKFAGRALLECGGQRNASGPAEMDGPAESRPRDRDSPSWDCDRQELWFCGVLVKRFRIPSPNQVAILSAFQEEGWPSRIDDPLPPKPEQDPKRRLHDTIRNLNRSHRHAILRFVGDGSGQGVLWESLPSRKTMSVRQSLARD